MGTKHSTPNESTVKDDIPLSTNTICDFSGNNTMIVQDARVDKQCPIQDSIDVSSAKSVPIVDTMGCGCMRTEKNATTIMKCNCGSQCMCVPPCDCKPSNSNIMKDPIGLEDEVCNRKQNIYGSTLNWVPHMFTKTDDIQDRFDGLYARLELIKTNLDDMDKRIVVLETISKKITEYVPLTAIPYCRLCKTIVLNGRVCDCGLIVE